MVSDELVWQILDKQFCSFKIETRDQRMCTNPYNVTGVCKMTFCPLANSRYATVIESKGKCYLCIKTVERAHLPSKMWEKILLNGSYENSLTQIEQHLPYWDKRAIARCKRRYTRLYLVLKRTRKLRMRVRAKMVAVKHKEERMLRSREARALRIAKITQAIEGELMNRLRSGVYGKMYDEQKKKIQQKIDDRKRAKLEQLKAEGEELELEDITEADLESEDETDSDEEEEEEEEESDVEFVGDEEEINEDLERKLANYNWEEEEEDIEDIVDDFENDDLEEDKKRKRKDKGSKNKKQKLLEIEHENERSKQKQYN
ncbi:Mak16 [Acrasis kona]|uniref:Protein MAK16 homolog n=1 Tax=Acrasis kona TaxID=1008807 RepID=A0AAW2ZCU4_9EUKA